MVTLPDPTPALVREAIQRFDRQGRITETAIHHLLAAFPLNDDPAAVLLKVIVINRVYSTSIYAVQPVAEMIVRANIDPLLQARDPAAVETIRRVEFTDQTGAWQQRNIYSFATKYCTLHQPAAYAMYDGLVAQKLWEYQKRQSAFEQPFCAPFQRADLEQYPRFEAIVSAFRTHFGLEKFTLREIDKFLWMLGKG